MLAHEVAKEVQHQQQLFPEVTEAPEENQSSEVTESPENQSSEVTEEPNLGQTEAANGTVASAEETSGSGDSAESEEGSSTEGSSESEEVRGMFNLIDGLSVESESESESTGSRFVPDP